MVCTPVMIALCSGSLLHIIYSRPFNRVLGRSWLHIDLAEPQQVRKASIEPMKCRREVGLERRYRIERLVLESHLETTTVLKITSDRRWGRYFSIRGKVANLSSKSDERIGEVT